MEKNKIRILHIVPALDGGGVENLLLNYYSHMDRSKYIFDFIVHGEEIGRLESVFDKLNSKIYHIPTKKSSFSKNLSAMKDIIYKGNYDIIHAHQGSVAIFPMYFAKKAGIKVRITHSHQAYVKRSILQMLIEDPLKYFLKIYSTHWFACGIDAGIELWGKKAITKNKVHILNNAIELSKFQYSENIRNEYRKKMGIENKIVIGNVGRLSDQKNHKFLIDIFKEIYDKNNNTVLLLIGKGELEDELKQRVEKFGLTGSVKFLGLRTDVEKLLQAMDIFLLPSKHEGLPVVLIEAQASGLMCYVSDNVTKEVKVTNLIEYISLDNSADEWAERILNGIPYLRTNTLTILDNGGYNIKKERVNLENLYVEMLYGGRDY